MNGWQFALFVLALAVIAGLLERIVQRLSDIQEHLRIIRQHDLNTIIAKQDATIGSINDPLHRLHDS